jgi:hypothetical protein
MIRTSRTRRIRSAGLARAWIAAVLVVGGLFVPWLNAQAATLSAASIALSDPRPNTPSVNYTFTASSVSTGGPGLIRCIKMVYADAPSAGSVPAGMTTTSATVNTAGTNYVPTPASWTLNATTNGTLQLTLAGGETPASCTARTVSINGITNGSTANTAYFLRFNTYSNTDCATGPVDSTVVQFIMTNGSTLSLTVDNTLTFTVNAVASGQTCNGATSTAASTSTTIPFGTVSPASNAIVCQDLTASTNATNGYTIYARYTAAPTNTLSQTIDPVSGSNASPAAFSAAGTEAYGYTTNDFTLGTGTAGRFNSNLWAAMTTSNAEVGYESAGVTSTTYRIGHQVGVSTLTQPGTYTTTVIYTCTPVF